MIMCSQLRGYLIAEIEVSTVICWSDCGLPPETFVSMLTATVRLIENENGEHLQQTRLTKPN
jgi:hypothetical protein